MTGRFFRVAVAVAIALCGAVPAMAADGVNDPAIDKWIKSQAAKMRGREDRAVRYAVVGDLDGDGRNDVAVLYTIDGFRHGDARYRFLAAFRRGAHSLDIRAHALVGGRGIREVNRVTILKRTIVLETLDYRPSDAMCCPTRPARQRYRLADRKLVRIKVPVR